MAQYQFNSNRSTASTQWILLLYEEIRNISLLISPPIQHYPPPRTSLGSLAKGSWLAARLTFIKCFHSSRHSQHSNNTYLIWRKTEGSPPPTSPLLLSPPTPYYPSPSTTTFLAYERSVCFASCKTLGVQYRASLPVPCQR